MALFTIIAAGEENNLELVRKTASTASGLLCADGGYHLCRRAGLVPDAVIGDMDSISEADLDDLILRGVLALRHPRDKDESDLELTLMEARRRGAEEVRILGALGGRLDHTLFNLTAILMRASDLGMQATILSETTEVRLIVAGAGIRVLERDGWTCSLIPLSAEARGITLEGFRYPLEMGHLSQKETRGLSNVLTSDNASISVGEGNLLCLLIAPGIV